MLRTLRAQQDTSVETARPSDECLRDRCPSDGREPPRIGLNPLAVKMS